jgi:signal transduction histidine kinase/CheY-like chemotaxis protein
MNFPPQIAAYLQRHFVTRAKPCCFLLDGGLRLIASWGDLQHFGFADLEQGAFVPERAPFLHGLATDSAQVLPMVTLSTGVACNIHVVPDEDRCYVVLLDAREEYAHRQVEQQTKNEVRLLHINQQRLIARQRDLISELVEARAELDHRRRHAERTSASKSRFIAMMSHEFRTPLASIINYAELALEEGMPPNDVRKSLEAILRSGRHMTSLVDAVLDEARIEAGQVKLSERDFSLQALVGDLSAIIAPLAADKGLSFAAYIDKGVSDKLRADDVCLRQILVNLLGNAVKFTQKGEIVLNVSFLDGRLVASVADTGPGISADDQERVFEAFERGEDGARQRGAGLGLAITLGLARLMKGEISLDSAPGKGCTVTVHVPVRFAGEAAPAADKVLPVPAKDNLASRRASVLVCDDDEDMIALVEFYLHRAGYGLMLARDGVEVVEKAMAYGPDLVIMDVNMPQQSGVSAARQLRSQGFDAPIVALTAGDLSDSERDSFTTAFTKPVPMQELLSHIKALTH